MSANNRTRRGQYEGMTRDLCLGAVVPCSVGRPVVPTMDPPVCVLHTNVDIHSSSSMLPILLSILTRLMKNLAPDPYILDNYLNVLYHCTIFNWKLLRPDSSWEAMERTKRCFVSSGTNIIWNSMGKLLKEAGIVWSEWISFSLNR